MSAWKNLIGERVLVSMSLCDAEILDRIVTGYNDKGFVSFDNENTSYKETSLWLHEVHKSEKYPYGYVWD
jgi:hypothetical protein